MKKISIIIILSLLSTFVVKAENKDSIPEKQLKHSVFLDPLLPFFDLLIVNYGYKYNNRHESVLGLVFSKTTTSPSKYIEYPGYIKSAGLNLGHRFYIYKGIHFDAWFMPGYNYIFEKNENKYYQSFSLYNEYRLGYQLNFTLFNLPFLVNFQWPVGFSLFDTNKPASFQKIDKQDPVFYLFFPNIWIGYRF